MPKRLLIIVILFLSSFVLSQHVFAECLSGQIDINQASAEDLDKITQIGPVTAGKIIEERNIKPFESLDDLLRVKGIGETTLAKIKQEGLACVSLGGSPEIPPVSTSTIPTATSTGSVQATSTDSTQATSTNSQAGGGSGHINFAPIAEAGDNIIANVGTGIHFDGSGSSDPDNDQLSYIWNLGNGDFQNQKSFDYAYSIPGKYVVTLEVNDKHLINTDSLLAEVYPQAIFISEFLPNPETEEEKNEWIEIGNFSSYLSDISGWQLSDSGTSSHRFVFPQNTFILPNAFLAVSRTLTKIALNNNEDKVRLFYPSGVMVDEVSYENAKTGFSAAKKGDQFFWTKILTPGMKNLIFLDQEIPKKTSERDEIFVQENKSYPQSHVLISNHVVLQRKSNEQLTVLSRKDYQVAVPTLADLDDLLTIKTAFAKNEILGKIEGGKEILADSSKFSSLGKNSLSALWRKPESILFGTTFVSSMLFGIWAVVLKRRFFS